MPSIKCASRLNSIGPEALESFDGLTLAEVLQNAGLKYPRLQNYILDDQQRVRKHVAIFINGQLQSRDEVMDQTLRSDDEIYLLQALSGG